MATTLSTHGNDNGFGGMYGTAMPEEKQCHTNKTDNKTMSHMRLHQQLRLPQKLWPHLELWLPQELLPPRQRHQYLLGNLRHPLWQNVTPTSETRVAPHDMVANTAAEYGTNKRHNLEAAHKLSASSGPGMGVEPRYQTREQKQLYVKLMWSVLPMKDTAHIQRVGQIVHQPKTHPTNANVITNGNAWHKHCTLVLWRPVLQCVNKWMYT